MSRLPGKYPFWPRVTAAFAVTALLYFASFTALEYVRHRRGPWEVGFRTETNGAPAIVIRQDHLGISNVVVEFPGGSAPGSSVNRTVPFATSEAAEQAPFGEVLFLDTTFLPGTVTLELFGHQVELLPRVLIVDHQERAWRSGERIALPARLPWLPESTQRDPADGAP